MTLPKHRALETALAAAREAAPLLHAGFRARPVAEHKSKVDLVTEYDRRSEALLVERLRAAFPDHRIVGEEGGAQGADAADLDRPVWYVDPLDGTVNFAHHLPWYAISIGLELGGEQQVAVVLAPESGWEVTAIAGEGAFLNGERIHVSSSQPLQKALCASGFPYEREPFDNVDNVRAVLHRAQAVRRMGTASLDLVAVACGWLDGYWEFTLKPWDISAGALLVQEAGGRVSLADGGTFSATDDSIVATNGLIHDELLAILKDAGQRPPRR